MPDRLISGYFGFVTSKPTRTARYHDNSVTHNALTPTALTQLATPCESHRVLNYLGELPRSPQPLHRQYESILPDAYPTMAMPATSNHLSTANHTRPPHFVTGPLATPTTLQPDIAKPPLRLRSSDHHRRDSNHLTNTSAVSASFRAAEQHAHRHGRDTSHDHTPPMSPTKQHRRPCPVQQLVRLPRRPITPTTTVP